MVTHPPPFSGVYIAKTKYKIRKLHCHDKNTKLSENKWEVICHSQTDESWEWHGQTLTAVLAFVCRRQDDAVVGILSDLMLRFYGILGTTNPLWVQNWNLKPVVKFGPTVHRKLTLASIQYVSTLTVYNAVVLPVSTVPRLAGALVRSNCICTISCSIDTIVNSAGTFIDILWEWKIPRG